MDRQMVQLQPTLSDGAQVTPLHLWANTCTLTAATFSARENGNTSYHYSTTILSIDLSQDWTNETVTFRSTSKPDDVPNLTGTGLWYDESENILYSGFAGSLSKFSSRDPYPMGLWSFKPDGGGSGTWDTAVASTDAVFNNITRGYISLFASGGEAGLMLGGASTSKSSTETEDLDQTILPLRGMVEFNMTTKTLTNGTVDAPRFHGKIEEGRMHHVPVFGPKGIFIVMGGGPEQFTDYSGFFSFDTVSIYDPDSDQWWDQKTTGNAPDARKGFCLSGVASDNGTYEVFVYGGYPGTTGTDAIPFDQIFLLTLPAFHWIQVDYVAEHPRHEHTCTAVGGSQILTLGGFDSSTTDQTATNYQSMLDGADPFKQGIAVFNMTSLRFEDEYKASSLNNTVYKPSELVQFYYLQNDREPAWNSTALQRVFSTTNFPTSASSSTPSSSASTTSPQPPNTPGSADSLKPAAIAGIVVGSILGVALVAGALWFYLRRRKGGKQNILLQDGDPWRHHVIPIELQGEGMAELHGRGMVAELQSGRGAVAHEKDGREVVAELAGDDGGSRG